MKSKAISYMHRTIHMSGVYSCFQQDFQFYILSHVFSTLSYIGFINFFLLNTTKKQQDLMKKYQSNP